MNKHILLCGFIAALYVEAYFYLLLRVQFNMLLMNLKLEKVSV